MMYEDEAALAARWASVRDAEAFRAIFVRYSSMVYSTCRRILPTESDAEEVAQECFEAFAAASAPPSSPLGPWLHRVATNLSLKRIRSDTRRRMREERYARERPGQSEPEWDDVYRFVDEAIAELPEKFRVAVVARHLEARTFEDIARTLEVSPRTVAYRVERGVALIRRALRKRGVTIGSASLASMLSAQLAEAGSAPSSLTAALGKLAVAGVRPSSTMAAARTIGGLAVMKKVGIAALVILGAALALWSMRENLFKAESDAVGVGAGIQSSEPEAVVETAVQDDVEEPSNPPEEQNNTELLPAAPMAAAAEGERDTAPQIEFAGASISGVVYDSSTGAGLDGVAVTATSGADQFEVQTDSEGLFRLSELPPGDYVITSAVPAGYVPPDELDVVDARLSEGAEYGGVEFAFELGGTLEGVITFGDEPASLARFELSHHLGVGETYVEHIQTDERGAYRLAGLTPGGRTVHFRYTEGNTPSNKIPVLIEAGQTTVADVRFLAGTASIEGVAYRDGQTPVAARIEAHFLEQTYYTASGKDGYYRIEELPAGPVQLVGIVDDVGDPVAPLQRRIFALELNDGDRLVQDIRFTETVVACTVSNVPETTFEAYVVALNGEVDFSGFGVAMLGPISRQRAALSEIGDEGTASLHNLEPGVYTIVAISFPSNPAALEALEGEALQAFIQNLRVSNAELITIEEDTGEIALGLSF